MIPLASGLATPARRAAAISIVFSVLMLGMLLPRVLSSIVAQYTSWRNVYWLALGLQYLVWSLLWLYMPDYPAINTTDMPYYKFLCSIFYLIFSQPVLAHACVMVFFSNAVFASFWTTLTAFLSGTLYNWSSLQIGLFALIGIAPLLFVNLAKRLTGLLPDGLDKALFLSTGGESNEAAIKLAKLYTGKFEIVGLGRSWHGMTSGANAAQYHSRAPWYGPMPTGNFMLPSPNAYRSIFRNADGSHDWQTELDYGFSLIDQQSVGSLAAVIVEPILSSAGMHPLPKGYLEALRSHCNQREMLLIIDEAQTAIGRAGDMFAFQHDGVKVIPDILTLSKTLGTGLPLSAIVTSSRIAKVAKERKFLFYTTHTNDPLPAAVGDTVLKIVVRDNLVSRSRVLGEKLHAGLRLLQSRYGCIGDVRGRGLMAGVEIVANSLTKEASPQLGNALVERMTALGLWAQISTLTSFAGTFRIAPPLTTTEEEIEIGLKIMETAFAETPGTTPLY